MKTQPRIALITYSGAPALTADDALLQQRLFPDFQVATLPWDQHHSGEKLQDYDAAIIRSTWNYTEHYAKFLSWLDELEQRQVPLFNSVPLVRWNVDKIYLRELQHRGHFILDTAWLDQGSTASLSDELHKLGADQAVVKPRISATARGLFTTSLVSAAEDQTKLDQLLTESDAMLQPFAEEIVNQGEWSLVFFGGEFSHSLIKHPKPGDHRVQHDFGGTSKLQSAPTALIEDAQHLLTDVETLLGDALLYARVDGIERGGRLALMELEIVEPDLFFRLDQESPKRFGNALATKLGIGSK